MSKKSHQAKVAKKAPTKPQSRPTGAANTADSAIRLVVVPRDGLFLKDGRGWGPAGAGNAHSLGWPAPSTLLGALRTACGHAAEAREGKPRRSRDWLELARATSLGPTLALRRPVPRPSGTASNWLPKDRVWPVPADALFLSDEAGAPATLRRLDPTRPRLPSLGRDDCAAHEALWRPHVVDPGKPARSPAWWSDRAWLGWLTDPREKRAWASDLLGLALPRHMQIHVGIDRATGAAQDEILFSHDVVETLDAEHHEWAIAGCFTRRPTDDPGPRLAIGGDRRLATIEACGPDVFSCPPELPHAFAATRPKGLRLIAVVPAVFAAGWYPDEFNLAGDLLRGRLAGIDGELILRACFVPRAAHVSGWDLALGAPKPTTRLVPPGAVFCFTKGDGGHFTADEASRLWLTALGGRVEEGYGRFAPGIWHPREGKS